MMNYPFERVKKPMVKYMNRIVKKTSLDESTDHPKMTLSIEDECNPSIFDTGLTAILTPTMSLIDSISGENQIKNEQTWEEDSVTTTFKEESPSEAIKHDMELYAINIKLESELK